MAHLTIPEAATSLPAAQIPSRRDLLKGGWRAAALALVTPAVLPADGVQAAAIEASGCRSVDAFLELSGPALKALNDLCAAHDHWGQVEAACDVAAGPWPPVDDHHAWRERRVKVTRKLGYAKANRQWQEAGSLFLGECATIREVPATTIAGALVKARLANVDRTLLPFLISDLEQMAALDEGKIPHS